MTRLRRGLLGVLLASGAAWTTLSTAALAAPGVVTGTGVNLRAGPGVDYPLVASLPPGTGAEIYGCLPGWTWCDVAVNGPDGSLRGWAAGPRLQVVYDEQPGYLEQYGPALGLPLIGFSVDNYWDRYYRGQPWYGSEGRWRGDHGPGPGYGGREYGGPGYGGRPGHDGGPGYAERGDDRRGYDGRGGYAGRDGPPGPGMEREGPGRGGPERGGPEREGSERGGPQRGGMERGGPIGPGGRPGEGGGGPGRGPGGGPHPQAEHGPGGHPEAPRGGGPNDHGGH